MLTDTQLDETYEDFRKNLMSSMALSGPLLESGSERDILAQMLLLQGQQLSLLLGIYTELASERRARAGGPRLSIGE